MRSGGQTVEKAMRQSSAGCGSRGILHPVIWSFLTGDKWFGEAGAACEMPQK